MNGHSENDLTARIAAVERRCGRRWRERTLSAIVGAALASGLSWSVSRLVAQEPREPDVLTVRGLVVVDERGVERVRIGAPLPDPIVQGKRVPRQGVVSGILIFDEDGDERGGYVTNRSGDAFLTLDAKRGQQALFIANRDGGANLALWSGSNRDGNYVSMRAVPTPFVEVVEGGKRVFSAGRPDAFAK